MDIFTYDKKIEIDHTIYEISDLDSDDVENYMSEHMDDYSSEFFVTNEVFIKYAHAIVFLKNKLTNKELSVKVSKNTDKFLKILLSDCLKKKINIFAILFSNIRSFIYIFSSFVYLFVLLLFKPVISNKSFDGYDGFYVSRSKADYKMIRVLKDKNILGLFDTLKGEKSLFYLFKRKTRICMLFKAFYNSFKNVIKIRKFVNKSYGRYCGVDSYIFYSKRIVHTLLFKYSLDCLFNLVSADFYTSDNIDRFAIIEEELCSKYKRKLICIPHGIEYGFILPHCFVGDLFYSTSSAASDYLNSLYKTSKFVYSEDICNKMFCVNKIEADSKIVYFSEPREPFVNIQILKELLKLSNQKIFLKLHPADDINNYSEIISHIDICNDFDFAISNSICIARKSTVLIEALYNNSKSFAVLINKKDAFIFNTFPSLRDSRIQIIYNLEDLGKLFNGGGIA